jgi:hypothetical protein
MRPMYYLNERLVDKKDIPANAKFIKRVMREEKWGGKNNKIKELYYEAKYTKNNKV